MARRGSTPRPSSQLAHLEQRVALMRRDRVPEVLVVHVFADDPNKMANAYATQLDGYMARAAPGTTVVLLAHNSERPAGAKPAWAPPRAWLDTCGGEAPRGLDR